MPLYTGHCVRVPVCVPLRMSMYATVFVCVIDLILRKCEIKTHLQDAQRHGVHIIAIVSQSACSCIQCTNTTARVNNSQLL